MHFSARASAWVGGERRGVGERGGMYAHPQMCKLGGQFPATLYAQLPWFVPACLPPLAPGGSALLVRREINTLQTAASLAAAHSVGLPMPAVAMETKVGLFLSATGSLG